MKTFQKTILRMTMVPAIFMTACVSLDEEPLTFITPEQFYQSEADANASCLGLYSELYHSREIWVHTTRGVEANNHDGRMRDANLVEPLATSDDMSTLWQSYYHLVRMCNSTIDGISASSLRDDIKAKYIGEAKALRASAYLRLAKNWGDVPMRLTSQVEDSYWELSPMKDVYNQVFADLNDALYTVWSVGEKKAERVDQAAVRFMIADAAITIAQSARSYRSGDPDAAALKPYDDAFGNRIDELFELAHKHLDTLINQQSYYKLTDTKTSRWIDMFGRTADGTDNTANSTEIVLRTATIPVTYTGGTSSVPSVSNYLPSSDGGTAIRPTYEYVASFDKDDIRRNEGFIWYYIEEQTLETETIYHLPYRQFGNEPYVELGYSFAQPTPGYADYPNIDLGERWDDRKQEYTASDGHKTIIFFDPGFRTPYCGKFYDKSCTSGAPAISVPVYRMAEAYLMFAEAEAALHGVTDLAVDHLNAIHSRAFKDPEAHTFTKADFADLNDFNRALLDEYIWEFALENKSFFACIRMGKLQERIAKVVSTYAPKFEAYDGPVLGVEAGIDDQDQYQYALRQRKTRGTDQYWLLYPYPGEGELNDALDGHTRMNY